MKFETIKVGDKDKINFDFSAKGFVVIGDVHLYNSYPYGSRAGLFSDRLKDIRKYLWAAAQLAESLHYPLIINGDLIHTGIIDHPVAFVLYRFFENFKNLTIFVNLGNHDLDGDVSVLNPFIKHGHNDRHSIFKGTSSSVSCTGYHLAFVPACNKVDAIKAIKEQARKTVRGSRNVLFIHATFSGAFFSNAYISRSGLSQGNPYFKNFDLIVASDVHKYQKICKGRGFYTSSLIPLSFGERTIDHGYHVVDLQNKKHFFVITKSAPQFLEIGVSELNAMNNSKMEKTFNKNIVCVVNDQQNKDFNKKAIKQKLLDVGASFVSFKNSVKGTKLSHEKVDHAQNIRSIILGYSKLLAKKFDLSNERLQSVGLRILTKAEMEMGASHQRR